MRGVLALVLAGGKGTRLEPLTRDRAKPAVPFGGAYRIIDFTLSNCINSGLRRILLLSQYKAASLNRHINQGWRFLCGELDEFVDVLPPQQRIDEQWYQGTADAVYQNIFTIEQCRPAYVVILSGDHIYKMDYSELIRDHIDSQSEVTVGCIPVSLEEGTQFGVMQIDEDRRIVDFSEKPEDPQPMPEDSTQCLASMGIYVFNANFLYEQLCQDATDRTSSHDFGKNIIPSIIHSHKVRAFPFQDKNSGDRRYWRDVGTLDSYYEANMDLVSVKPNLNLYDSHWPIRTFHQPLPPPKFVFNYQDGEHSRVGTAVDSLVCSGSIVSGGKVDRSVLSANVRVNSYARVENSILFEGVEIGRDAHVKNAIIDKYVTIQEGVRIGYDLEEDRARGFEVTESGVVVIGKQDNISGFEQSPDLRGIA